MYDLIYEDFYFQHKHNLKEIFYPIKKYFSENINLSKYLFFPKYGIILDNHDKESSSITNFGKKFSFQIDRKIKKIKLYIDENKYKEFWTCGLDFTKFYFSKCRKKRICIKSNGSFKSIDFKNDTNFEHDTYYLYPKKEFNSKKVIDSLLYIDWNNPPEEINFIIEKGIYSQKYKKKKLDLGNDPFKTFFHNAKVGMTLSVISNFITIYRKGTVRIFYYDCHYIYNSSSYRRKKYFLYFLNFLFFQNESNKAKQFLMKVYYNFAEYNNKFEYLLEDIINFFENKEILYVIFDNIHSSEEYTLINKIKNAVKLYEKNIIMREFIEINADTLNILEDFLKKNKMVEMLGKLESETLNDDLNIILEVIKNKEKNLKTYKEKINNQISLLFKKYSLSKYLNFVKLFYYLYSKEKEKNINFDELKDFIDFLYINITDDNVKIGFRNNIIESLFKNFYIYYHSIFFNEESKHFLKEILESEKGYNFERQIIFSIIIGNYSNNYNRVKIKRIYCVEKFEKFENDKNILFYQIIPNAPIYDFAILIKNKNGDYILKAYQVFINKSKDDLEKLEFNIIEYDLNYFIEKLCRIMNIKIKTFTFGIITSYQRYKNKNENLQNISNFCRENQYELLLYDIEKNMIFMDESKKKNEYNLEEIPSFEAINNFNFNPCKIFKEGCKILQKYYIEKINSSFYEKYIKEAFNSLTNNQFEIDIKLIGKFKSDISAFTQDKNDKIFIYSKKNQKNQNEFLKVYYNNFQLYEKKYRKANDKKGKEELLVFKIKNFDLLKNLNFSKLHKVSFKINEKDKETNINYLIFENEDNEECFIEKEENDIDEEENNINDEESDRENKSNDEIITLEKLGFLNKNDFKSEFKEFKFQKDFNGYNYAIINSNLETKKLSDFQNNQNDDEDNLNISDCSNSDFSISEDIESNEEKELIDNKIDFNSYEFQPRIINKEVYDSLLNGNTDVYNSLINFGKKSHSHSIKSAPSSFLKMKRSNTSLLHKTEEEPESLKKKKSL